MLLFLSLIRKSFRLRSVYQLEFWIRLFSGFLGMYCTYSLWNILYRQSPGAFGFTRESMITYGVLAMALNAFYETSGPQWYIADNLRTGALETDLMKPVDFHFLLLSRTFGEALFGFITMTAPCMLIGTLFLGLQAPASPLAGGLFGASLLMGFLVQFSIDWLMGMLAILTLNIDNLAWVYYGVIRMFAGQLVPLWLFPKWLAAVAGVLPFKAIFFVPLSIYTGQMSGAAVWSALTFQAVWVVTLVVVGRLAWHGVHSRLVIQGG